MLPGNLMSMDNIFDFSIFQRLFLFY